VRRSTTIATVAAVVAAAGTWLFLNRSAATESGPVRMDVALPTLTGESLDRRPLSTDDFSGQVLVINVWATWCVPCAEELPDMKEVAERYAPRGVSFLGLNYRDDRAAALVWQDSTFDLPYPSLFDPRGQFAHDLEFPWAPDTYVVDASGRVRWAVFGKTDAQELSGLIDDVLAGRVSSA
jgi:thiol-disulfide isomerase/thioredoxin